MFYKSLVAIILVLIAPLALAHETHVYDSAFMTGFTHPVLGLDHLLAMVAVGVISAVMGGKAIWQVPAFFVIAMIFGGVLGGYEVGVPGVEIGISASVIALGAVLAIGKKIPMVITFSFVVLFGIFHGHAHGTEMPEMIEPLLYGTGFVSGTIALHLFGVLVGVISQKIPKGPELLRFTGVLGGMAGIYLLGSLYI